MTEIEQQIYNDLSTAGWNLFTDNQAKLEVAQHLARKGWVKNKELIIDFTPVEAFGGCRTYEFSLSRNATLREMLQLICSDKNQSGRIFIRQGRDFIELAQYRYGGLDWHRIADIDGKILSEGDVLVDRNQGITDYFLNPEANTKLIWQEEVIQCLNF